MKPTIDAINLAIRQFRDANERIGANYWYAAYDLAIQALTEMKHRQNLSHASDVTVYEVLNACDDVLFSRSELMRLTRDIAGQTKQDKPRTWRDVTLGEVKDFYKDATIRRTNSYTVLNLENVAEAVLSQQPNPLKLWRSMGA